MTRPPLGLSLVALTLSSTAAFVLAPSSLPLQHARPHGILLVPQLKSLPVPGPAPVRDRHRYRSVLQRVPPPMASDNLVPAVYTGAALLLLQKASNTAVQCDAAVLASTGLLALFNFGPTDAERIASAMLACEIVPPASSGVAKQRRQAARTWRSAVRLKVIGQMAGLAWMLLAARSTGAVLRGAALVMTANVAHLVWGAGSARHDSSGDAAPMAGGVYGALLATHAMLAVAAFLGAACSASSTRRIHCALLFSVGALGLAFAGLPAFLGALVNLVTSESDEDVYVPPSEGGPTD